MKLNPLVMILLVIVLLIGAMVFSAARYYSQIELRLPRISWRSPTGSVDLWFATIELYAPASFWSRFLRVDSASFNSLYFSSVQSWRTEPEPDEIMFPWPDDRPERFENSVKEPLEGSSAPLRILMEIHRTKSFAGYEDYSTVTVSYRYFGFKRQLSISRQGLATDPYRVSNSKNSIR